MHLSDTGRHSGEQPALPRWAHNGKMCLLRTQGMGDAIPTRIERDQCGPQDSRSGQWLWVSRRLWVRTISVGKDPGEEVVVLVVAGH